MPDHERRGADVPPPLALDINVTGLPQSVGGTETAQGAPAPEAPSPTSDPDDPAAGAVRADS
jgi:hypothetical protein